MWITFGQYIDTNIIVILKKIEGSGRIPSHMYDP